MALSTKLELKQSQSLVMTPQLQQAIKLLQLSNLELEAYVAQELERNPLLEREEGQEADTSLPATESDLVAEPVAEANGTETDLLDREGGETEPWLDLAATERAVDPTSDLDADYETLFPDAGPASVGGYGDTGWAGLRPKNGALAEEDPNLEALLAEEITLKDHLTEQLNLSVTDPRMRLIGHHLIDMVDEAGYLRGDLVALAERLGASQSLVEETLSVLQGFEPTGVFARNVAECLALQLKERGDYDPTWACFLSHIDLLGAHKLGELKKRCGLDEATLGAMIRQVKTLNPKPGLKFGRVTVQPVVPDVIVRQRKDGGWHIELNADTLPKVLVNRSYYATLSKATRSAKDKEYLTECLQTANWLVKSLDQRARTILKVSREIVRQQDAFFTHGIEHLRPLNLKTVADAINMHESTVSRVTSNKYMVTNRGIFEMKYFFTSAIPAAGAGEAHSSEAVRFRIKQLIDKESPDDILSDDKIVALLRAEGVNIARRTVAKYREAMRIPSSVQRRREKRLALQADSPSS